MAMTGDRLDGVRGYSTIQIGLHWLIAALVLVQLVIGESMAAFVEAAEGESRFPRRMPISRASTIISASRSLRWSPFD